jgi:predicted S18 family serine protease
VRLLATPALPLDEAGKYVVAAYLVFLALILIYVAIMATRLTRIQKDIAEIAELVERRSEEPSEEPIAR